MLKTLVASSVLIATAAATRANTISGTFRWAAGTTVTNPMCQSAAQTVQVMVGSTAYSFSNSYVPGQQGNSLGIGQPVLVLKSGSVPFAATYASAGLIAFDPYAGTYVKCNVPMNTSGALVGNIVIPVNQYDYLELMLPACTVGSYSFPGGLTETIQSPVASFSLTTPTGTGSSCGSVTFPTGSAPRNLFSFTGTGDGTLSMVGASSALTVPVAGYTTGTATTFSQANLKIVNNQQN